LTTTIGAGGAASCVGGGSGLGTGASDLGFGGCLDLGWNFDLGANLDGFAGA